MKTPKFDPRPFDTQNRAKIYKIAAARHVTKEQLDVFFSHVTPFSTGCWVWTGRFTKDGLPLFLDCPPGPARLDTKMPMAHRTAFSWFRGVLMPYRSASGLPQWRLKQTCGTRACVNPVHLRQVRVEDKEPVPLSSAALAIVFAAVVRQDHGFRVALTDPMSLCWYWQGDVNAQGYPVATFPKFGVRSVDEVVFEWFVGYGEGESWVSFQIHHRCRIRSCVNPAHFELVPFGRRKLMQRPGYVEGPIGDPPSTRS